MSLEAMLVCFVWYLLFQTRIISTGVLGLVPPSPVFPVFPVFPPYPVICHANNISSHMKISMKTISTS